MVGYSSDKRWGGGYSSNGNVNMYYPDYNYNAPEEAANKAINATRKNYAIAESAADSYLLDIQVFSWMKTHYDFGSGKEVRISDEYFNYLQGKFPLDEMAGEYQLDGDYKGLYKIDVNFYASDKSSIFLKYTYGQADIYYRIKNGQRVYTNFGDTFDFDPRPW
jgi:hypothetical protein